MAISKFALLSLSTNETGTSLSISDLISPFWSSYDKTFYKNLICPKKKTYNLGTKGYKGGILILKDIFSWPFNYVEQNDHIKMLIGNVWEMMGVGRVVTLSPIAFDC